MPAIALVTDLIFSTKITGTAKALSVALVVVRSLEALQSRLDEGGPSPLVIIDLNAASVDPIAAIGLAKSHPSGPGVVAYLSHVQTELAAAARSAGADQVLPRSAFVAQLAALLQQAAAPPNGTR
ncbi:MAG TPA: response regulator [Phycisphaerae bacterium]|jgi:CheY-like chemotaxis protein|nr:response regulator [Phycisphaerae bacterium]